MSVQPLTVRWPIIGLLVLLSSLASCVGGPESTKPAAEVSTSAPTPTPLGNKARLEQRQAILKMRAQTLRQLHQLKPTTRAEIDAAAGCGVFEVNGLNAVLAGAHGRGVIFTKNGAVTYMRLLRTDVAPGAPIKPYWQVLVFRDAAQLARLTQTPQSMGIGQGPGVVAYRLSAQGVSNEADWGAQYVRSPELN